MGSTFNGLNGLFKQLYLNLKEKSTVDDWMKNTITEEDIIKYPNAKIAAELKASPLAEVMSEEVETEERQFVYVNPITFNGLLASITKNQQTFSGQRIVVPFNLDKDKKDGTKSRPKKKT